MKRLLSVLVVGFVAGCGTPGFAQSTPASRADIESRYQIGQLERVLEGAVEHGVTILRDRMQTVTQLPMDLMVSDNAHARGFRLEGYGIFFDVIAPSFETSSLLVRMLDQNVNPVQLTRLSSPSSAGAREQTGSPASTQERNAAAANIEPPLDPILSEPNEVYRTEVTTVLKDAMLDHSGSLNLAANEWLTVAVKGNDMRPRLAPADTTGRTVVLRLRGGDLAAFLARQIERAEALQRIEVKSY